MKYRHSIFFVIALLILVSLACTFGGGATEEPEAPNEDTIATSVAATLMAEEPPPEETQPALEVSPESPTATDTPEPTLTPSPVLKVAYLSGGNVWLWTEGAGAVQLTHAGQATNLSISDDGFVVAFVREVAYADYELWAVNTDGSDERRLLSVADFDAMPQRDGSIGVAPFQLGWVPGTHTLAFNTRPLYEGPGLFSDNNLHLVDVDGLTHTLLLPNGQGGMFYYSPNGAQIAIITPTDITLVNAGGGNRREMVTYPNIYTYSEYAYYPEPHWLPGSRALLVAIPPEDPLGDPGAPTALWRLPAGGSPAVLIRNVVTAPFFISPAAFSPDGRQVAYLTQVGDETSDRRDLNIMAMDGSSTSVYASGTLWFSSWSPDSLNFAYAMDSPTSMKLGQVGAGSRPLTDTGFANNLRWVSADDILFEAGGAGSWEIRRGVPGGSSVQIAYLGDEFPVFDFTE
ncbi:MAG: hypothetical protein MAG431_00136 [Chloroflexi bacterium]|nr:hypothetical protein [Chloroflexota bacterium]